MNSSLQVRAVAFPVLLGEKTATGQTQARPLSDEEAMARLRTRDNSALDLLFDRYSRLVFTVALRVLRDSGEAEDVVQEVFTQIYEKTALFDVEKGTAKSWIVRSAFHRALDRRSYLTKRNFYAGTDLDALDDTLSGELDLDRQIDASLSRKQLQQAFAELSDKQRQTLELYFFEGLELTEVAERLNEPLGNVRHHYYRGLEKLRKSAFIHKLKD